MEAAQPTSLDEHVADMLKGARKNKQQLFDDEGIDASLTPTILIVRGGQAEIYVMATMIEDSRELQWLLHVATTAYRADALVLVFEGWGAREKQNPDTGQDWGPGEMQQYVEDHGRNDAVGEAVNVLGYSLDGDVASAMQTFDVKTNSFGRPTLAWDPEIFETRAGMTPGGAFLDALRVAFGKRESMEEALRIPFDNLDDGTPMAHMSTALDVMATTELTKAAPHQVDVLMAAAEGSDRYFMLRAIDEMGGKLDTPEKMHQASELAKKKKAAGSN